MQKENQPYKIEPASRLSHVSEYYFSRKLKEVARMNAEGKNVISLGIGSPDMPPSEETINVLCENARKPDAHGYQPTVGIPELRKAMADWYKRWYDVDLDPATEIQPLIGSKEGILHVTLALVNPGDQVLVPNPGYPTYTSLNKILGSEIVNYNLREDNHWQPDFEELEKMDLSRVKIMWTNYPNMPTGGNARMENSMADCLADIEADAYILDCVPNATAKQIAERTGYLVRTIRAKHAKAPIIVMQSIAMDIGNFNLKIKNDLRIKDKTIQQQIEQLQHDGIKKLYFIRGEDLIGHDHEGTGDGIHPNDLGFQRMVNFLEPVLMNILQENELIF